MISPDEPASKEAEAERLREFMREQNAKHLPSEVESGKDFLTNAPLARDPERLHAARPGDAVPSQIRREPRQPWFPEAPASDTTTQVGTSSLRVSFLLSDATTTEGDPPEVSNKVLVLDGKIDKQFPTGMGFGNYILDIPNPEAQIIYAGATFNPQTLQLTSRFLGVSGNDDYPQARVESIELGFLYWALGYTYFDANDNFIVWNQRLGDIYLELIYGSENGREALWAGDENGWLDLDLS